VRKRIVIGGVLASVGILAAGVESAAAQHQSTTASGAAGGSTASSKYKDGSYTGTAEATQYGDVQVKVTIAGGRITAVTALQLTNRDGRSI
jgi:uncharacterized protein with FMN-binding domain